VEQNYFMTGLWEASAHIEMEWHMPVF
jgi:hypothetical protein